ncbi:MAG TPA: alpha/beta fold hydrolase [Acidimicrobiales bacterium]|jgi:3-oxoadipate enol-lactonase|nr:alpha/beta fold hydrolase [Acidimicrobiales bacterium]
MRPNVACAIHLNFTVEGPAAPNGPWLLCLHSLATDLTIWDAVAPALAKSHRVLRADLRGHGRSPSPPPPYALDDLVQDVVDLLDRVDVGRVSVLGLSVGGMVALGLALDHAGRVDKLIVADARADAPPAYRALWDAAIDRLSTNGLEAVVDASLQRWFRLADEDARAVVRETALATPEAGFVGTARAVQGVDYLDRLHAITAPTLFITGEHDPAAPPDTMADMARRVPGARLHVIPGAAHLTPVEDPEAFTAAVTAFL